MNMKLQFQDLGNMEYQAAWDYQQSLMDQLIERRQQEGYESDDFAGWFLAVEHPHVYTLGKSGDEQNLLLNYIQLQAANAQFIHTNRGGDITYHGPGQFVGYPIIDLEKLNLSVRRYIYIMEEAIILALAEYGIKTERLEGATGVWIDGQVPGKARKICAIGVRVSRYVTMHGFALNINTDLSYFGHINPCGFTDKAVTSMQKELGTPQDEEKVKKLVFDKFAELIQI